MGNMRHLTKDEIRELLASNKELLIKYKVKSLALFGSSVRGEMTSQSDIDFLVEFDNSAFSKNLKDILIITLGYCFLWNRFL
ncbi:MAG: nucleotidyltransferase domain-containing protein [Deltaproteobacteria bacterium]|nr:nucleotidyltransferase domain-containing protein [Deltaproteobacteria bacterium]